MCFRDVLKVICVMSTYDDWLVDMTISYTHDSFVLKKLEREKERKKKQKQTKKKKTNMFALQIWI